jgi:hypothetical protein
MPRGGRRPSAGRPRGATSYKDKSESRKTLETRLRELNRRGTEDAKRESCKIAIQLLPYDEPRLQAVMSQAEITHTYVARIPSPILDIEEWQKSAETLLLLKQ